jgi:hypothetical protein
VVCFFFLHTQHDCGLSAYALCLEQFAMLHDEISPQSACRSLPQVKTPFFEA